MFPPQPAHNQSSTGSARAATIVISDWLANCRTEQWTPFEAATALKAALAKEGYSVVPAQSYAADLAELAAWLLKQREFHQRSIACKDPVIVAHMERLQGWENACAALSQVQP